MALCTQGTAQGPALRAARPYPDQEGLQTIREVLKVDVNAKIIAMSGGGRRASSTDYLSLAEDFGAKRTFPKPFDRTELLKAVRELLDERA